MSNDKDKDEEILKKLEGYEFAFENLAFEGGGVKGVGHIGMIEVNDKIPKSIMFSYATLYLCLRCYNTLDIC